MEPYWSEANGHAQHSVKYESEAAVSSFPYCTESSLNFSTSATTYSEDDAEYATGRRNKTSRQDPLSHRIIEKRRRDRMNSCLADLSRLIPPQYQRKGRGRIEKTEIIEMAIRHLKHLKNECNQKENDYRLGYTDCMKEVAKFLYDSQMQEFCYRLLARLQEHCDEIMKTDCYKSRNCHGVPPDNVSASSGSPHQMFHPGQPLCQLRDMIASSDIEHSNDHNDVKDLSFRNHLNQLQRQHNNNNNNTLASTTTITNNNNNTSSNATSTSNINGHNNGPLASSDNHTSAIVSNSASVPPAPSPPTVLVAAANTPSSSTTSAPSVIAAVSNLSQPSHQAPVITSTAPASLLLQHQHHTDSSNHDFESSREPILHTDTSNMHSPPPRDSLLNQHSHHAHLHHHSLSQHSHLSHHHNHDSMSVSMTLSERMRNYSESSHDVEHNNNYKYKNHIKERFNHELHDEETSSEHCHPAPVHLHVEDHSHTHSMSEHSKDGTEPEIAPIIAKKRKMAEAAAAAAAASGKVIDDCDTLSMPAVGTSRTTPMSPVSTGELMMIGRDEKPFTFGDIKTELNGSSGSSSAASMGRVVMPSTSTILGGPSSSSAPTSRSFSVPIFALHGQGTYYIPLNIDYNALVPFLNGIDLLEKNYASAMPVVHPININVNFMPATPSASFLAAAAAAVAVAAGKQHHHLQPQPAGGVNGAVSATAVAAITKSKLKNGW